MKNIILVSSTLCTIAMLLFINWGNKRINQSQEEALEPVQEWFDEMDEKHENMIAAEEARWEAKFQFSERMKDLSLKQESITNNLISATTTEAGPSSTSSDTAGALHALSRRQNTVINEFKRLNYDLRQELQGIADYRHIQALDSIQESNVISHLEEIKTKLSRNQSSDAAESSKVWADQMSKWATLLESN